MLAAAFESVYILILFNEPLCTLCCIVYFCVFSCMYFQGLTLF